MLAVPKVIGGNLLAASMMFVCVVSRVKTGLPLTATLSACSPQYPASNRYLSLSAPRSGTYLIHTDIHYARYADFQGVFPITHVIFLRNQHVGRDTQATYSGIPVYEM